MLKICKSLSNIAATIVRVIVFERGIWNHLNLAVSLEWGSEGMI
jgi:hypothetical protein